MNVRIFAVKNENVEYKIQKADKSNNGHDQNREEEYNKIREENEELKSKVDQLQNTFKRHSTADPSLDTRGDSISDRHMIRSRSPVPGYPEKYDLMSRKYSREERRDDAHMINNGSGSVAATNYYQEYASPLTKSAVSERSWIDKNEVNQNASNEQAQLIIEKLTKVINHLQNELCKNTLVIEQLIDENRRFHAKADSSYQ